MLHTEINQNRIINEGFTILEEGGVGGRKVGVSPITIFFSNFDLISN